MRELVLGPNAGLIGIKQRQYIVSKKTKEYH
jgi:hypothetical protein